MTRATASLFSTLGVHPALGRPFAAGEQNVVVLGHKLWTGSFASDPRALGSAIQLDGQSYTVIGIMPPGIHFPNESEVWVPYAPPSSRDTRSTANKTDSSHAT